MIPPPHTLLTTLSQTKQLHAHITTTLPNPTTFLLNTLIRLYTRFHSPNSALSVFRSMLSSSAPLDSHTFTFALTACSNSNLPRIIPPVIHAKSLVSGFGSDNYVGNSLVCAYMGMGDVKSAMEVFDGMPERSVVSWNCVINGLVGNGCVEEALGVFDLMVEEGVEVDKATVVSVLPACGLVGDLRRGRLVHGLVVDKGFKGYVPARNALIDMYVKCGCLEEARRVFEDGMWSKDVVSWTTMIGGCVLNGCVEEALDVAKEMVWTGIRPNAVTLVAMLSACSGSVFLNHGKCFHGLCVKLLLVSEIIVETSLIEMYGRCGDLRLCSLVFAGCSGRTATWNTMISCFRQNGLTREAMEQFRLMLVKSVVPNKTTIMSVLPACSDMVDAEHANNMFCYLIKTGFSEAMEVATCLVHVYSKIGRLEVAHELFDRLPEKDIVAWSAIVASYGMHGHAKTAVMLFDRMVKAGIEPNEVTFTSILYSCSHAGLVDEGLHFFKLMSRNSHTTPGADHYACIVDLLGRAGRLKEAHGLIERMPCEPNHAVWGALLGACAKHRNVELGEVAAWQLFKLEPENTGNYVLMGNLYAEVGRWDDAESVRNMLKDRGLRKAPGCSLIEDSDSKMEVKSYDN